MFDVFEHDEWGDEIRTFWTFSGGTTGTYIMTALGIALMLLAFVAWVRLEQGKLAAQAELLRAAGGLPAPGGIPPGPGPSQPPLAGPQTEPGD
jgi:hypothetical protein